MANVRGCNLPDDLLYDVDNHIWYQEVGDGTVKLGMTTVATAMASEAGEAFPIGASKIGTRILNVSQNALARPRA